MSHLMEAKDLMREFPEETEGFTVFGVEKIWEDHSETYAAGWLIPEREEVAAVFNYFNEQ